MQIVTKLDISLREKRVADLADELRSLAEASLKESQAIQEAITDYVATTNKIIEEMSNAK